MAIDFDTDGSGLFRRTGAIINVMESINSFRGDTNLTGATSLEDGYDSIWLQFAGAPEYIEGLRAQLIAGQDGLDQLISDLADQVKNVNYEQANADDPLANDEDQTVLDEIYEQLSASDSLDANATSATVATVSATGDTHIVVSIKLADGRTAELLYPEVIDVICATDEQTGATADQETYTVTGEAALADFLDWNWPTGSGVSTTITAIDAADTTAATNMLEGTGDFEDQTSNVPDGWTLLVGAAGTNLLTEAVTVFKDSKSIEFVGDAGGTLTAITFPIDTTNLDPNTVLHFSGRLQKSASLAAGVMEASLIDGSNAYITDDQSNNLAVTLAHGSIANGSWTKFGGAFALPAVLPSTVKFRLRVSTALTDGESVFADHFSLTPAGDPIYDADGIFPGGIRITAHSGATAAVVKDKYSVTIANDLGGEFQTWLWRIYGPLRQMPSDSGGSETIPDSYIEP